MMSAVMDERRQLLNVAYRLLGSLADAEDVVQEAFARWYALAPDKRRGIASPGAWLTTVTSRICLDLLGSARVRRERYVGEWIPEPLPGDTDGGAGADPADRVTLDESVNMAFLVVLENMTPAERVAFVLHDVFRYSFAEVAAVVGRSPGACRQLASSARRRIESARVERASAERKAGLVRQFARAWAARDIDALIGVLDPDAVAVSDGGGDRAGTAGAGGRGRGDRAGDDPHPHAGAGAHRAGADSQRPARARGAGRRRHHNRDGVRGGRRPDHPHLGRAQPGEAADLDKRLTRPGCARMLY
ncbi:hypothetical protein GCM10020218_094610 [Dactylosporangium vinaceum]